MVTSEPKERNDSHIKQMEKLIKQDNTLQTEMEKLNRDRLEKEKQLGELEAEIEEIMYAAFPDLRRMEEEKTSEKIVEFRKLQEKKEEEEKAYEELERAA